MECKHIGVPLNNQDPTPLGCGTPREVNAEELAALVVELVLRGVEVLRLLLGAHCACAEAERPAAWVRQREHDPGPEAVVEAAAAPAALAEPGSGDLLAREPVALRRQRDLVPRARGVANAELAQHLLLESPARQVLARELGLAGVPEVARVVVSGALHQLEQPLAALAAALRRRVLLLALELDVVALGESLYRLLEVEPLGLLHEADRVAGRSAPEAVVELVLG